MQEPEIGVFHAPPEGAEAGAERLRAAIRALERSLRAERARGRAGCRSYDLARHARLARSLRCARSDLARLAPRRPA